MRKYSISAAIEDVLTNFLLLQKDINSVSGLHKTVVQEVEKILITKILNATRNNKRKTATILGLSRNTLNSKITSLCIEDPKVD